MSSAKADAASLRRLPQRLLATLRGWPEPASYWVAYSGGLDSTVLLHILAAVRSRLSASLHAVHVHHGLQPDADAWEAHCARKCADLGIDYRSVRVWVSADAGQSVEAAARRERYHAFDRLLPEDAMLLTAHHRDDQVETVLLQLLRGAGPAGLAGIAELRRRGDGWTGRPLLQCDRTLLWTYAREQALHWVEDTTNSDLGRDRNYLRHCVLPELRTRWPGLNATLSRSAQHCGAAARLAAEVGDTLFRADARHRPFRLAIAPLLALPAERQSLLLRHWLMVSGLTVPDTERLRRLVSEVARSRPDAMPCIRWPGAEVRRYGDTLYAMPPLEDPPDTGELTWTEGTSLELPAGLGQVRLAPRGLALPERSWRKGAVRVRFGGSGVAAIPAGRRGRRSFKRLCQEWHVPPWLRPRVPLVFIDGALAAVGDYGSCEPFAVRAGEPTVCLNWERPYYLA